MSWFRPKLSCCEPCVTSRERDATIFTPDEFEDSSHEESAPSQAADHNGGSANAARQRFEDLYSTGPPWEIDQPQPAFVDAAEWVQGDVLDSGCGTGENALFFAARGHSVLGVDLADAAIVLARRKAANRNSDARFEQGSALELEKLNRRFDTVLDSGLFHIFDDEDRAEYVVQLARVLKPGGTLLLACFSDKEPPGAGPRRVTEKELRDAFAADWRIVSLQASRYIVRDDLPGFAFSAGGAHAWFARIERAGG